MRERTAELLEVNKALAVAKRKADEANLDKTRFLAAASHDVLQPLNAARLYVTSMVERPLDGHEATLARNIDASLEAVEEILNVLIEIARFDTGRMDPDLTMFPLNDVLERLAVEFEPMARGKGLDLRVVPTGVWVRSDRRLLRRVLQNLVANGIKYTPAGKVLLGVRRRGDTISVQVVRHRPRHPEGQAIHHLQGVSAPRGNGKFGERIGARSVYRRAHRQGARSPCASGVRARSRLRLLGRPAAGCTEFLRAAERAPGAVGGPAVRPACLMPRQRAGRAAGHADLAERLGLQRHHRAQFGRGAGAFAPGDTTAGYHPGRLPPGRQHRHGAVAALRAASRTQIPAIIITADHSAEVQREVRLKGHALLRKPLKAAALRALMHQLTWRRAVAAE